MNMNLLRIFHATAKLKSFTRAAAELHLTQPGISKHIKELEEHYGTRLFDRVGKRVVITQAGEILFRMTSDIFNMVAEAEARINDLRGLARGKLSIGSSITIGTYVLPELLVEFRRRYPYAELKLDIGLSQQAVDKVLDHSLEIAFIGHYEHDKRLVVTPFMTDRLLLIVAATHEWGKRTKPVPLQKLVDQPFLLSKQGSGTRTVMDNLFKSAGLTLRETMELGTTEGVKHAVAAGLGVSILSEHMVRKEVASGCIKTIPVEGIDLKRDLYLVRHKDRYLSEAAQAFLNLLDSPPFPP
jgi:DNA-binding transcriptional LysR family regulator